MSLLEAQNLAKRYKGREVVKDVSLQIRSGEIVGLLGPNGAGKTTFIRLLLGYYHATQGNVSIMGRDPIKHRTDILKHISFVPQLPPPIKLSLQELLHYICKSSHIDRDKIFHFAQQMELDIKPILSQSFFKLSGGMKQKLLIAISLAKDSEIMIYDEPTANLDPKARDNFYRLLKQNKENKTMLFVTHRLDEVKELVNREIYFDLGKVVSDEKI
jgi:ABC-2 type transport system ATP-binding protein